MTLNAHPNHTSLPLPAILFVFTSLKTNLVPRAFSSTIFKMAKNRRGEGPGDEVVSRPHTQILSLFILVAILNKFPPNTVPRAFSSTIFKMADRRRSAILKIVEEKALGTVLGGNLFKMATKIKSERIWV